MQKTAAGKLKSQQRFFVAILPASPRRVFRREAVVCFGNAPAMRWGRPGIYAGQCAFALAGCAADVGAPAGRTSIRSGAIKGPGRPWGQEAVSLQGASGGWGPRFKKALGTVMGSKNGSVVKKENI